MKKPLEKKAEADTKRENIIMAARSISLGDNSIKNHFVTLVTHVY